MDDLDDRVVLHVDIDAFFAASEQVRDPRLAGKPVIVGAGVIASCSYEARRYGLRAGTPLSEARRLCPQAVVLDGHEPTYRAFAARIWALLSDVTPDLDTYLDEAYGDVAGVARLHGDLVARCRRLQKAIADALTHTGQLAMMRRLHGAPMKGESYNRADIVIGRVGSDQTPADPKFEFN